MDKIAYLDIETSYTKDITIIGIYRPGIGTRQLVGEKNGPAEIMGLLEGVETIFTYNGTNFDLPVIFSRTNLDLSKIFMHKDLMYDCWRHNLYGGLKKVEVKLGIFRDTEGLSGIDAMRLWDEYKKGSEEALEVLLRYNREDVENLEILARKLESRNKK